jgi:hypothetical protein
MDRIEWTLRLESGAREGADAGTAGSTEEGLSRLRKSSIAVVAYPFVLLPFSKVLHAPKYSLCMRQDAAERHLGPQSRGPGVFRPKIVWLPLPVLRPVVRAEGWLSPAHGGDANDRVAQRRVGWIAVGDLPGST